MEQGDVLVDGEREKASMKLRGGERIAITGEPHPAPLKATAEDIPLDVVFEDSGPGGGEQAGGDDGSCRVRAK